MPIHPPSAIIAVAALAASCHPPSPTRATAPRAGIGVASLALIPLPEQVVEHTGAFLLTSEVSIAISDAENQELRELARDAAEMLRHETGIAPRLSSQTAAGPVDGGIALLLTPTSDAADRERYRLEVTPQAITVSASSGAGLFYGLGTLGQLVPLSAGAHGAARPDRVAIPAVTIVDRPRFSYRGMHLDVGRHFFPVEVVKRYIDLLATYKMNTFHWHLTEDQGWRIEIEKYPRLTQVGAWRRETILEKNFDPYVGDGKPYGGFYTKDEIRDVVEHARRRYVTVIPEIEMPGHSIAALAAYPELACTEGPFEVGTRWGIYEDVYCPTEETFAFLEAVLDEVLGLFPGRYVHIGGDEVPKRRWKESPAVQDLIRREGLTDEHELQSWFIRRIERFLLARGRRLIGWDEILEGGLAPEATVMSWRGMEGGIEAARQGHDVIMTPTSHLYLDYYQGDPAHEPLAIGGYTPLERVYQFEPVPDALTPDRARHVLGAQGNVWTEYIKTADHLEYMVLPRMIAIAEVVWSPKQARDWSSFTSRLGPHLRRLDRRGVHYRIPDVTGLEQDGLTLDDRIRLTLGSPFGDAEIRYTTDGTMPTADAPRYLGPLELPVDEQGVVVTARAWVGEGRAGAPRAARFRRTSLQPPSGIERDRLTEGLAYAYYEYDTRISSVVDLAALSPAREGVAPGIGLQGVEREERFAYDFRGYLQVPRDGIYTFVLTSDDGSRLLIGDRIVVDHDGRHDASERSGMVALRKGLHRLRVLYFQAGGGKGLGLTAAGPGVQGVAPLAGGWLFRER